MDPPSGRPADEHAAPSGRFGRLFHASPVALALLDEAGTVLDGNPALLRLLGLPPGEVIGRRMIDFTHADDQARTLAAVSQVAAGARESVQIPKRVTGADRRALPIRATVLTLAEPSGAKYRLAQLEDLSLEHDLTQARRQAAEDPLTGVANRRSLQGQLDPLLERSSRPPADELGQQPPYGWSLLFVDLDDFKNVNDRYGHDVGDKVLVAVARRLVGVTRDADLVCRLGGDEFVLLLNTAAPADVQRAADRVRRSLGQPIHVDGHVLRVSASVGSAVPRPDDTAERLLSRADTDMYRDKHRRRY